MVDESKQTEEADMSRLDFTETHSQDTMRNLQRISDIQLTKIDDTIEMKGKSPITGLGMNLDAKGYHNLPEEDVSHRGQDKRAGGGSTNKKKNKVEGILIESNGNQAHVFTQGEEEKTQDLIKSDYFDENQDEIDKFEEITKQRKGN